MIPYIKNGKKKGGKKKGGKQGRNKGKNKGMKEGMKGKYSMYLKKIFCVYSRSQIKAEDTKNYVLIGIKSWPSESSTEYIVLECILILPKCL